METNTAPSFELRNAGIGPDPLSLEVTQGLVDFAIVLLLRDYHCPKCRAQVQRVAEKATTVKRRDTAVLPVLPDSYEKARQWQSEYELPFPLLADPRGKIDQEYDQPTRFGAFGKIHDLIGKMPKAVVLDLRDEPTIVEEYEGSTPSDRPAIETLLERVDELREGFVFDCDLVEC